MPTFSDKPTPKPVRPPQQNYSIINAFAMEGKTVQSVEVGHRASHPECHEGELIVLHFTDGTSLAIDTGSNAQNVCSEVGSIKGKVKLKPSDFHTDFMLQWYK